MQAIVNVSENWGIGFGGQLLFRISADLRRFRQLTEGKTVILGRKTLRTFPGGRPLPNRQNLILSHQAAFQVEGAQVFSGMEALLQAVAGLPKDQLAVIGGASVYRALLPYCTGAQVTRTLASPPADCFFPNLDELPGWHCCAVSPVQEENGLRFQYLTYENRNPLPV